MPYFDEARQKWRAQVRVGYRKHTRLFARKKDAAEWEVQARKELEKQERMNSLLTLSDFVIQYLEHAKQRFVDKTFKEKFALAENFLRWTGNLPVEEVFPQVIHEYLIHQAKTRSANAANKDRKNLLAMWSWGGKILDIPLNPVTKIEKLPHDRQPQYTPSPEDLAKVLAVATREEGVFLSCYLQTAARRGEVLRWKWDEDIEFNKEEVRLGTRKTRDGSMEYEWLPMTDQLLGQLWYWYWNRPVKDSPYVFCWDQKGRFAEPGDQFTGRRRFMDSLCTRAGVKPFGFHAIRRYVASMLADTHQISSKTVQRILRHKNLQTTERYLYNVNRDLRGVLGLLNGDGLTKSPTAEPHTGNKEIGDSYNRQ